MKTVLDLTVLCLAFLLALPLNAQNQITKADRVKAATSLKATQKALAKAVKGLSETQLNYKPDADSWSIAECIEHISKSEEGITMLMKSTLQTPADPSGRSEIKMSDEQVYGLITDRSQKVKTRPELEPQNTFGSVDGSLTAFTKKRKANIKYIKKTQDDLRNHYFEFPFGKVDAFQIIMFMSGHTERHTKQIMEVMASDGFPKST